MLAANIRSDCLIYGTHHPYGLAQRDDAFLVVPEVK